MVSHDAGLLMHMELYLRMEQSFQEIRSMTLVFTCVYAQSLQSCPILCSPVDCSPPGSPVQGILQARILEWVAVPSCRGSCQTRDQTQVFCGSCIVGGFFTTEPPGKPVLYIVQPYHMIYYFIFLKTFLEKHGELDKFWSCRW